MEFLICVISSAVFALLSVFFLNIVQLDGYALSLNKRWIEYYYKILTLAVVGVCICFTLYSCYATTGMVFLEYFAVLFPLISLGYMGFLTCKEKRKVPIKYTPRMTRLFFVLVTIVLILNILLVYGGAHIRIKGYEMNYILLMIPFFMMPALVFLSLGLIYPIERFIQKRFINDAKAKIKQFPQLIKIGITGSFGKTSVKNILATLLEDKFVLTASPHSFNTPMGLCRTINDLTDKTQVLIAEMGARHIGDIKELCDMVRPKYAIITGVAEQHLQTFKTVDNIIKTKYELVESIDEDGYIVFNGDNKYTKEMYGLTQKNKGLASLEIGACVVSEINTTSTGSDFTLKIDNDSVRCSTMLIGKNNILNIAMASLMAHKLGIALDDIARSICRLEPTAHRLEVMKTARGITIIDDTYNSNFDGFCGAMDTIGLFTGRKIVVTPGLVELGDAQQNKNFEIGQRLSKCVAVAILIGDNANYLRDGMIDGGFDESSIYLFNTLEDAKSHFNDILKTGDIVLMENDLPDNY